ncbi:hypothetical protein KG112_08145 [Nocardioides sp. zg-ZUI104]|uniref:dCTP deaminase domain-containing protein n=1 Tax=Nocardioides faecalis TaxID=2803858 RepID=UPI001BCFC672|nr:hypothetical protein [Nocardioides faecalis]MBS4752777.1 hypothetical protein [Nocardioides faecalis]
MFLSARKVRGLIEQGNIKLEYAYVPDGDGFTRTGAGVVNLSDEALPATGLFLANSSGTRLQLTVGPMARSHNDFAYAGRAPVQRSKDIFDIAAAGAITVEPRETVTILANEYVEFDNAYAALVTPRVTMTDAGFLLTSAYVDPGYKGLLRVTLNNATNFRQTLKMLEPIAQLLVYKVSGQVDSDNEQRLLARSVFYGTSWARVLGDDVDPFPRRKTPLAKQPVPARAVNAWRSLRAHGLSAAKSVVAFGYVALIVTGLIGYGRFEQQLEGVDRLEQQLVDARSRTPLSGREPVTFDQPTASVSIRLERDIPSDAVVVATIAGVPSATVIKSEVDTRGGNARLIVDVSLPQDPTVPLQGEILWIILP